jgi:hypothetical protein
MRLARRANRRAVVRQVVVVAVGCDDAIVVQIARRIDLAVGISIDAVGG